MTVSSGKNGSDPKRKWEKEQETERIVGAPKDLFRDMFYVKALDIPEKAPENLSKSESQKNSKQHQQVYTIINYILFYGTKLGLWVRGSLFKGQKRKKSMNGCAKVYWPQVLFLPSSDNPES